MIKLIDFKKVYLNTNAGNSVIDLQYFKLFAAPHL